MTPLSVRPNTWWSNSGASYIQPQSALTTMYVMPQILSSIQLKKISNFVGKQETFMMKLLQSNIVLQYDRYTCSQKVIFVIAPVEWFTEAGGCSTPKFMAVSLPLYSCYLREIIFRQSASTVVVLCITGIIAITGRFQFDFHFPLLN